MAYNAKTDWKYDDPVTEDDFNRIEQGIKDAHNLVGENASNITAHEKKRDNPHRVTKSQVGLGEVLNEEQATKSEFNMHTRDNVRHITSDERADWDSKETPEGAKQKADKAVDEHANDPNAHGLRNQVLEIGEGASANGDYAMAFGTSSSALEMMSAAFGVEAMASGIGSLSVGAGTQAIGDQVIALGIQAISAIKNSIAMGTTAKALDENAVGLGSGALAEGYSSTSIGAVAKAIHDYSVAIGVLSQANGLRSCSVGYGAIAEAENSIAIGVQSESLNADEIVIGLERTNTVVPGSLNVAGAKNFEIPHPHPNKKYTHRLRHASVESPTAGDTLYRYTVKAVTDGETVEMQLPDYFQYLNKDVDVWVNGHKHFGRAFGEIEGNLLKVTCEKAGEYKVLVIGTRNDDHPSVKNWGIKGVEREIGETWTGGTCAFKVDEIAQIEEIKEVS